MASPAPKSFAALLAESRNAQGRASPYASKTPVSKPAPAPQPQPQSIQNEQVKTNNMKLEGTERRNRSVAQWKQPEPVAQEEDDQLETSGEMLEKPEVHQTPVRQQQQPPANTATPVDIKRFVQQFHSMQESGVSASPASDAVAMKHDGGMPSGQSVDAIQLARLIQVANRQRVRIDELTYANKALSQEVGDYKQKLSEKHVKKVKELQTDVDDLRRENEVLLEKEKSLSKDNRRISQENRELHDQIKQMRLTASERADLNVAIEGEKKAKAEAARLRKQLSDQGSQLRNERTNFTIELRELRETMTSEVDSRKKVEYAYAEYKQSHDAQLKKLRSLFNETQRELWSLTQEYNDMFQKHQQQVADESNMRMHTVTALETQVKADMLEMQSKQKMTEAAHRDEIASMQFRLEEALTDRANYESSYNDIAQQQSDLNKALSDVKAECSRYRSDIMRKDNEIVDLKEQVAALRRAAESQDRTLTLERQLEESQSAIRDLQKAVAARETSLAELREKETLQSTKGHERQRRMSLSKPLPDQRPGSIPPATPLPPTPKSYTPSATPLPPPSPSPSLPPSSSATPLPVPMRSQYVRQIPPSPLASIARPSPQSSPQRLASVNSPASTPGAPEMDQATRDKVDERLEQYRSQVRPFLDGTMDMSYVGTRPLPNIPELPEQEMSMSPSANTPRKPFATCTPTPYESIPAPSKTKVIKDKKKKTDGAQNQSATDGNTSAQDDEE